VSATQRLSLWLRLWAPLFAGGGALFYLAPGRVTGSLNLGARVTGLAESPVDADNVWVVLAVAYMAVITGLSQSAAAEPLQRRDLVRLLILGKAVSSLGALGYFIARRRSYAFALNFALDGTICATTWALLRAAERESEALTPIALATA